MRLYIRAAGFAIAGVVGGCASQPPNQLPAWTSVASGTPCAAIAGSYSDKPADVWSSIDWRSSQSLANILLSYRGTVGNLLGIVKPYARVTIAASDGSPLEFTLVGSDGGEAPILLSQVAKCEGGLVSIERQRIVSAEGTTNF